MFDASSQPDPGFEIGGYRIVGRLGHGAMAEVYDAVDATGHAVALKVFRAGGGVSPTMLERFRREAEAAKKLRRHPNILTVYATGHEGDYHFIAMERVEDSRTLECLISGGASVSDLLQVAIKVASALHYAHEHQIIHRDVKPSNIMLDGFKEPLLTDFGVAELTDWPSCTLSGALTGTPLYMSPEQARSERVAPAADVYSLAVVLYEALTGQLPYELPEAPSTSIILEAVKHQEPIHARKRTKRVNRDLDFVLQKALRKKPDERYSSVREFAYDLEAVAEGRTVPGRWVSPWTSSSQWAKRNRNAIVGLVAVAMLGLIVTQEVAERFREERYRNLVSLAETVSLKMKIAAMNTQNRTEPEMRSARRAMAVGKWMEARDLFQTVADVNQKLSQPVAQAEALLGWARCETMLHNSLRAQEVYLELLELPEATPMRHQAGFELQMLYLLDGEIQKAETLLQAVGPDQGGPYIMCMQVAQGQMPPHWEAQQDVWKAKLRAAARIANVLGQRGQVSHAELRKQLKGWSREAGAERLWPIPLFDYLAGRL